MGLIRQSPSRGSRYADDVGALQLVTWHSPSSFTRFQCSLASCSNCVLIARQIIITNSTNQSMIPFFSLIQYFRCILIPLIECEFFICDSQKMVLIKHVVDMSRFSAVTAVSPLSAGFQAIF